MRGESWAATARTRSISSAGTYTLASSKACVHSAPVSCLVNRQDSSSQLFSQQTSSQSAA